MERTLVVIKPDAVQRKLIGRILARFEEKGLRIAAMKLVHVSEQTARELYRPHEGKHFYEPLVEFLTAAPAAALVIEGLDAISVVRKTLGKTTGREAEPGTIRGDFGMSQRYNLVHGSDSPESAEREIHLLFTPEEILDYDLVGARWVYARLGDDLI
jgi:nucleoside-diphosphate kinase